LNNETERICENKIDRIYIRATSSNVSVSPKHTHLEWEVIFVVQGNGQMEIENFPSIDLKPGTIICVPPNVAHVSHVKRPYRSVTFRAVNYAPIDVLRPLILYDSITRDFEMLCLMMLRLYIADAKKNSTIIYHLIFCMQEYIKRQSLNQNTKHPCVDIIKQYIYENFTDCNIDLNAAIISCGYSLNYCRACFRADEGITPNQFLLNVRMDYAERLLHSECIHTKIKDIALQCGFEDPMYFSRVYKKVKGRAPSDDIGKNMKGG
jgi:AraC-like DNA-binding protein